MQLASRGHHGFRVAGLQAKLQGWPHTLQLAKPRAARQLQGIAGFAGFFAHTYESEYFLFLFLLRTDFYIF